MTKLQKNCWADKWERGEQLKNKEGNQAHAFMARRLGSDGPFDCILKTLRRQDDAAKRAMFCNETTSMSTLDHPQVPALQDSNSDQFRNPVELYLVVEYIDGQDLESLGPSLAFYDKVRVTMGVLKLLDHCHSRGVVHRDIKPCHVIVKKQNTDSPFLIDFGIAHNENDTPEGAETVGDEARGNRFLVGPEHLPGRAAANRSPSTDICQTLGLLFYLVTGHVPGALRDEESRKPHDRIKIAPTADIAQWQVDYLKMLFDKGFEWHPDSRWNSASDLSKRLSRLLADQLDSTSRFQSQVVTLMTEANVLARLENKRKYERIGERVVQIIMNCFATIETELVGARITKNHHSERGQFLIQYFKKSVSIYYGVTSASSGVELQIGAHGGIGGWPSTKLQVTEFDDDKITDYVHSTLLKLIEPVLSDW